jgi:mono/diheme cytochrome c family protein
VAGTAAALIGAVTADAGPATPVPVSAFRAQAAGGSDTYLHSCVTCHGDARQGTPGKAEPLEGSLFQRRNPTALEIFDVVRSGREPGLVALTDDQVWAAIAAELAANGVDMGDATLGFTTAATARTGPMADPRSDRFSPPGH